MAYCSVSLFLDVRLKSKERINELLLKEAASRFTHLAKFSLTFSSSLFGIRVNGLHPLPSLFLEEFVSSLRCFSIFS